ncbi:MAG: hypothetical protein Q8P46_18285 [Hyphomicrobiales bacterium]|nr:hypothetical protein [Hyphomicrobiales bacterium]
MTDLLDSSVVPGNTLAGGTDAPAGAGSSENAPIECFARIQATALDQGARHRHEVELVANLETHAKRAWYIDGEGGVRAKRGDEAAERLRREVWALLKAREKDVEPMQEALL